MLLKLIIKNVALIENAEIEFTDGLNVMSGETGSGKSVILESINFVLGAKADKNLIRTGEAECLVVAEFDVSDSSSVAEILAEFDIESEDTLVVSRKITITGKNSIKINGVSATVAMVKKLTQTLIDVHGQSEHFHLLNTSNQLKLLDKFSGEACAAVKSHVKTVYEEYKGVEKELTSIGGDESSRILRLDVLNYQIKEIEDADIKETEFEDLTALKEKLVHRERIIAALSGAKSCLSDEGGASDIISNSVRFLNGISALGENYALVAERLNGIYADLDDVSSTLSENLDELEESDFSLEEVEDRLKIVKNLFKKYGGDYNALCEFLDKAKEERDKLEKFNEYAADLAVKSDKLKKTLYGLYENLSDIRKKYANIFSENVVAELKELGMTKSEFFIQFKEKPSFSDCGFNSSNGFDDIEFMFSANLGEPVKPLSEVISGGEMSRFMLAIKAQTAKYNEVSTFIFDEIDAGISGIVARVVAEKLSKIALSVQVIAVSHLPQITSFADNNLLIEKKETDEKTITTVKRLDNEGKINEITRLLGAINNEEHAIQHAKTLIASANEFKTSLK